MFAASLGLRNSTNHANATIACNGEQERPAPEMGKARFDEQQSIAIDMDSAIDVTVIMPCFNAAATIASAVESVLAQNYAHFSLIVVDDGSSDDSPDLVEAIAARDPRLRILRQANTGPSAARNYGVSQSTTPYIAFLDADDIWSANHLALNLAKLKSNPRLGVSFARSFILSHDGQPTGERTRPSLGVVGLADLLASNPTATCSALVVRRKAFDAAGPMRSDMVHAEDQEWLFRVAATDWKIGGIEKATVGYRTSPSGLSSDVSKMQAGWHDFVRYARTAAPDAVSRAYDRAHARMQLYWARRRMRGAEPAAMVRRHLAAALVAYPRIALERPATIVLVACGCLAPDLMYACAAIFRRMRHA